MIDSIKLLLKSNYYVFKALRQGLNLTGYFKRKRDKDPEDDFWRNRIETVLRSPDNQAIKRVAEAGEVIGDVQVMHNGLKIHVGSYYGDANTILLYKNKGVHEPQEEKVFDEILQFLPENAVMLELGSFWAFYSMSFKQKVKNGTAYLIEPDPHALISGKHNFRLNGFEGKFFRYSISDTAAAGAPPSICVDEFMKKNGITHLSILHSDIQGFEFKMLHGAKENLKNKNIDYIFISTHSNELHENCKSFLLDHDYAILCDANLDETYSWDGLIVAKSNIVSKPVAVEISKKV